MDAEQTLLELLALLEQRGVEVRTEPFELPSDRAGGLCRVEGHNRVILDARASTAERLRALLEAVEGLGLRALGVSGKDLSPSLLRLLTQRGHMTWPHPSEAPSISRARKKPSHE